MNRRFLLPLTIAILVLPSLNAQTPHKDQPTVGIEGAVITSNDTPLSAILIRVYRGGNKIGETKSANDGSYRLTFPSGAPVAVSYYHSAWHPGTIGPISGVRTSRVNKVLLRPGESLTDEQALAQLQAYEYIHRLEPELREPLTDRLAMLKNSLRQNSISPDIAAKAQDLLATYNKRPPVQIEPPSEPPTGSAKYGFWDFYNETAP